MGSPQKSVSSLEGSDRTNLLNTNARLAMENMGYGDMYQHMQQVSENTNGRVQPYEIFATVHRESKFNPNAKSKISSASGWGQFVKDTAKHMNLQDPFNPEQSVYAIGNYLDSLKKGGALNPIDTQQAYMLGGGGFRKMKKGRSDVAGLSDVKGLVNTFNKDVESLEKGIVSSKAWTGRDAAPRPIQPGEMSIALNRPALGGLGEVSQPQSTPGQLSNDGGALSPSHPIIQQLLANNDDNREKGNKPTWYKQRMAELFS